MLHTPSNTETMKNFCPQCKKEVKIIDFGFLTNKRINPEDQVPTTLKMVGCIECNNLFYKKD